MKEKILRILGHLSQSLLSDKDLFYDAQEIWQNLSDQGYSEEEIESALAHIERTTLRYPGAYWSCGIPQYRIYTRDEMRKLSPKARGYLWMLKSRGIIDHALEDEIVQKSMDLEETAGVREVRTVAALTVFSYEHRYQDKKLSPSHSPTPLH